MLSSAPSESGRYHNDYHNSPTSSSSPQRRRLGMMLRRQQQHLVVFSLFVITYLTTMSTMPKLPLANAWMISVPSSLPYHHRQQQQQEQHRRHRYRYQGSSSDDVFTMASASTSSSTTRASSQKSSGSFPTSTTSTMTSNSSTVDARYYGSVPAVLLTPRSSNTPPITLDRYLDSVVKVNPELRDLQSLLLAVQMACKTISNLINRAGLVWDHTTTSRDDVPNITTSTEYQDGRFYSMKRLDQLSTLVLRNALHFTGQLEIVAPAARLDHESPAQHQPGVLIAQALQQPKQHQDHVNGEAASSSAQPVSYVACLDPLDGSGNADASICTGTVFGVFPQPPPPADAELQTPEQRQDYLVQSVLQPAQNMRAAGYCLYSSATVLVFSLGDAVQGFTLDPQTNEFVLTHPNLTIPARGNVYSCNEGNSEGWDENFRTYLRTIKTGQGQSQQRYAHRYVGSMVGDVHRTLLYGGIFAYPADSHTHPNGNLQLLYKTAPLAFVLHHAGGKAIDGRTGSLLQVTPARVHQKSPCFMGSPDDVAELELYLEQPN